MHTSHCSPRRRQLVIAGALLPLAAAAQQRGNWPAQTVKIVVPFPPGGTSDVLARALAPRLSARLGQSVVVENRAGAGGNIGASQVAKGTIDGHTFLLAATSVVVNPALYPDSNFVLFKDLVPVSTLVDIPCAVLVKHSLPVRNLQELIAMARNKPGQLTMVSAGYGTVSHVAGELLKALARTDVVHVPFKGQASMVMELLAGRVDFGIDLLSGSLPHVTAGKLRAIAVTSSARLPELPDVPTAQEQGLDGYVVSAHQSLWAPGSMPPADVARMNQEVVAVLRDPETATTLKGILMTPAPTTTAEAETYLRSEVKKWSQFVKGGGANRG